MSQPSLASGTDYARRRTAGLAVLVAHLVAALVLSGAATAAAQPAALAHGPTLLYSAAADYSGALPLDGAVLSGKVAVHLDEGTEVVDTVTFALDGDVVQVEDNAPWNLSGNTASETRMLDTADLAPGRHTVDADVATASGVLRVSASFTVGAGAPPAEEPDGPPAELLYSLSADYTAPQPLDGAALSGPVAVFVPGGEDVRTVRFTLDGEHVRTERSAPYDLSADTRGRSHLLDVTRLADGVHTVTAEVTSASGRRDTVTATFRSTRPVTPEPPREPPAATRTLTVDGDRFLLDGAPFDMWGVRTASATFTQDQTDHLIAQLDSYRAHGVNTVAVYYMGSRNANYDPFTPDGRSVDAGHQARMEQIIRAADERGMVVVVGIFYQAAPFGLRDAAAVRQAVRTVTAQLRPYRNVVLNIANEQNSREYADSADVFDLRDPDRVVELLSVVHAVDPERVAGGGGYRRSSNLVIGSSPEADVLLFDTGLGGNQPQLQEYRAFRAAGITKPAVNVEQFGGYTNDFPRGVFPSGLQAKYRAEIASAAAEPGLYTFFHSGPWLQVRPMRYDLAGDGTAASPGIAWYFERVREATADGAGERP